MAGLDASLMSRPDTRSARRSKLVNPLLDAFNQTTTTDADIDSTRAALIARYEFAMPTEEALDAIGRCSPGGVVEVGAGTGYWAHALRQRGVDVAAFDIAPAPSPENRWFAGTPPWHLVHLDDSGTGLRRSRCPVGPATTTISTSTRGQGLPGQRAATGDGKTTQEAARQSDG